VLVIVLWSECGCETYHGEDVVWVLEGAVMKDGGITRREGWWAVDGGMGVGNAGARELLEGVFWQSLLLRSFQNFCVRAPDLGPCASLAWPCLCRALLHVSTTRSCSRVSNATALYMWRSNVLGLRNCSSARPIHHGLRVRCYSSASLPVSNGEFRAVLNGLLKDKPALETNAPIGMQLYAPLGSGH
jgi:hypothetical protein